jgi:hypothetical protein
MITTETQKQEMENDSNCACLDIKERLLLYQLEKLSEEERNGLKRHLLFCPECIFHLVLTTA